MSNPTPSYITKPVAPAPVAKAPVAKAPVAPAPVANESLPATTYVPMPRVPDPPKPAPAFWELQPSYPATQVAESVGVVSFGSLRYAKAGNNPPAPPAITIPTVNGVPQTELPHMPPGYSYR